MPAPPDDIDSRADRFSEDVVRFIRTILPAPGTHRTIEQLVQSSGSIAANRKEAVSEAGQLARILGKIVVTSKGLKGK